MAPGWPPTVVVPLTCLEDSQVFVGDESVLEKSTKLRETQLLAMIRHPYIVQYEDCFVEDGSLFVSMEFAGAGTLERYTGVCRERRWSLSTPTPRIHVGCEKFLWQAQFGCAHLVR
jgi:serine/threonine protein kinase